MAKCSVPSDTTTIIFDNLKNVEEQLFQWIAHELQLSFKQPTAGNSVNFGNYGIPGTQKAVASTLSALLAVSNQCAQLSNWCAVRAFIIVIDKFLELNEDIINTAWYSISATVCALKAFTHFSRKNNCSMKTGKPLFRH